MWTHPKYLHRLIWDIIRAPFFIKKVGRPAYTDTYYITYTYDLSSLTFRSYWWCLIYIWKSCMHRYKWGCWPYRRLCPGEHLTGK